MTPALPVVLVHGALRSRVGMLPTALYLERCGFVTKTFGYATRRDSLMEHARSLGSMLESWLDGHAGPIGILTHSMGGLVARAYLTLPGVAERWASVRLVMLAPPNRGAILAARLHGRRWFSVVYGRAADELLPARVASLPPLSPNVRTLVLVGGTGGARGYNPRISGDNDGLVGVDETHLEGAARAFVGGVHGRLQWRRDVLDQAAAFFGQ